MRGERGARRRRWLERGAAGDARTGVSGRVGVLPSRRRRDGSSPACSRSRQLRHTLPSSCAPRRYHDLYLQVKGARYKTKRVLMEQIHQRKAEASRVKVINDQANMAKTKAESKKTRKTESKKAQVA